jgi:hypothetical protein
MDGPVLEREAAGAIAVLPPDTATGNLYPITAIQLAPCVFAPGQRVDNCKRRRRCYSFFSVIWFFVVNRMT